MEASDLQTGRTLGGVWRNRVIAAHPDTGLAIGGLALPSWSQILTTARNLSSVLQMGYVGIDIVLDTMAGPVVLEAVARATRNQPAFWNCHRSLFMLYCPSPLGKPMRGADIDCGLQIADKADVYL